MKSLPDYLKESLDRPVYESELEKYVYTKLQDYYSVHRIEREVKFENERGLYYADFVINYQEKDLQIIIEVKATHFITARILSRTAERVYPQNRRTYLVLTDGENALITDGKANNLKVQDLDKFLASTKPLEEENLSLDAIKTRLHNIVEICYNDIRDEIVKEKDREKLQLIHKYIDSLENADIENIENDRALFMIRKSKQRELYRILLGSNEVKQVIKFSGERSLYSMLDYNSMNMCSLICMNDPSEKDYADSYVGIKEKVDNSAETFIISACEGNLENNLTMWRLYADDAKGVCTRFDIIPSRLFTNGFFMSPVSYASEDGYHFELEIIKYIKDGLPNIIFNEWNIWKHFFKKNLYAIEQEVRLLYFPSEDNRSNEVANKWFKDDRTSIYSEMKLFDLTKDNSQFPLLLNNVVLGVKFPLKNENAGQFNRRFIKSGIIRKKTAPADYVSPSKIEDYR